MSTVHHVLVSARRLAARRPWIHWLVVGTVAVALGASVFGRVERLDDTRRSWGETQTVWVASADLEPGDALLAEPRDVPIAVAPERTVTEIDDLVARQRVGRGDIVTENDVAPRAGPQSLVPEGWLAVPVVESPRSGAAIGDRVQVVSDGFVVSDDALVVALFDDVTLLAAPASVAPLIPAAAGDVTILLKP